MCVCVCMHGGVAGAHLGLISSGNGPYMRESKIELTGSGGERTVRLCVFVCVRQEEDR